MKTVKKYTFGKRKGWNIRQTEKWKTFEVYKGNVCKMGGFDNMSEADSWLMNHLNIKFKPSL